MADDEIAIGDVKGYKRFVLDYPVRPLLNFEGKLFLKSAQGDHLIEENPWVDKAKCLKNGVASEALHKSPDKSCSCGFYAASDPRSAASYGDNILTVVAPLGRTVTASMGWRAAGFEIVEMYIEPSFMEAQSERIKEEIMNALIKRYNLEPQLMPRPIHEFPVFSNTYVKL